MKKTELKRKTELKPGKPIERKTKLKNTSTGLCAKKRAQRRAYAKADDAEQCWCTACGKPGPTDHSHHFSQGNHDAHRNDERNWIRLCRPCHELFENKRPVFAAAYPAVWAGILHSMKQVDPVAFQAFEALHTELFPLPSL